MAEEIDFENGRNSNFEGLVTLTFDPAIRHIVLQQSSTSTYIPTFIQIEETFCGRTDVRTDIFPLYTIRSTFGSRPNNIWQKCTWQNWQQNYMQQTWDLFVERRYFKFQNEIQFSSNSITEQWKHRDSDSFCDGNMSCFYQALHHITCMTGLC